MDYIEVALKTIAANHAGLAALVAGRVYPAILPPNPVYPAMTYQTVAGNTDYHMEGPSGLRNPRVQIDLYASTHMGLLTLDHQARAALSGFRGDVGTSPALKVQGIFCVMELDAYEEGLERAGPRVWRKTLDFNIWFEEN